MDKNMSDQGKHDNDIIEAGKDFIVKKQERIKGAREGFSGVSKKFRIFQGSKSFLLIALFCGLAMASAFLWKRWHSGKDLNAQTYNNSVRNILPTLKLMTPVPPEETSLQTEVIAESKQEKEPIDSARETIRQRKLSPHLRGDNTGKEAVQLSTAQGNSTLSTREQENELQSRLQPLRLDPSVAGKIINPDYMLTQGAMIDCQLETRLITTQPGMASCYATRNIYSTNGRVVLIDRGSKIVGNYQGGMQQGQARIFVLWTRIETPKGVIINLDSPGSGALGESGLGGTIDTHFWERFGGAVMMSLIGDLGEYAARTANKSSNNTTMQLNNTRQGMQQAAVEALKNSINIPPTLYKNQGERVAIFVARDLDFSKVYGLQME